MNRALETSSADGYDLGGIARDARVAQREGPEEVARLRRVLDAIVLSRTIGEAHGLARIALDRLERGARAR